MAPLWIARLIAIPCNQKAIRVSWSSMRYLLLALIVLFAAPAGASTDSTLGDAERLAARGERGKAIARLRQTIARDERRDTHNDPGIRCFLGILYLQENDLSRAHLYLSMCRYSWDQHMRERGAAAQRLLTPKLSASNLSPVEVVTQPEGARIEVSSLPGDFFQAPQQVWLRPGIHRITASTHTSGGVLIDAIAMIGTRNILDTVTTELKVADGNRALVQLDLLAERPAAPTAGSISFSSPDPGLIPAAPPPPVKRDSLLPAKYRKGLERTHAKNRDGQRPAGPR